MDGRQADGEIKTDWTDKSGHWQEKNGNWLTQNKPYEKSLTHAAEISHENVNLHTADVILCEPDCTNGII